MNFTIAVSEIKELFSLIKEEPAKLFEMMVFFAKVGNFSLQKTRIDYFSEHFTTFFT